MGLSKECPRCKKTKWWYQFSRNKSGPFALNSPCKTCDKKQALIYRNANIEQVRLQTLKWRRNNKDKVNKGRRRRRKEAPHIQAAHNLKWRKKNPEKIAQQNKRYRNKGNNREAHSLCTMYQLSMSEAREAITNAQMGLKTTQQAVNI